MTQLGFYFDAVKCMGCRSCQVACKDRNNLTVGTLYRNVKSYETGEYPDAYLFHYAATCNHCADAACVENCPTGAMQKAADGTVVHDDAVCIGCGTCVESCPYGVPVVDEGKGLAGKCDSCHALRDAGLNPACVDACIMRCLDFGDLEELKAKYGKATVNVMPFLPEPTTNPSVLIVAREGMQDAGVHEIIL